MKKIILSITILCLISSTGFSQAFKKNSFVFNGGLGVGIGLAFQNYTPSAYSQYNQSSKNPTAGLMLPIAAEFALNDTWGIGLTYANNTYINFESDKSKLNNIGVFGALHFSNKVNSESYLRLNAGLSFASFNDNTIVSYSNDETYSYKMTGGFFKPSIGFRNYFGEHFGIFLDGGLGIYSVSTNTAESSYYGSQTLNEKFRMKLVGAEITFGLAVKL